MRLGNRPQPKNRASSSPDPNPSSTPQPSNSSATLVVSSSSHPPSTPLPKIQPAPQLPSSPSHDLLTRSLDRLSDDERAIIREHLLNSHDIDLALERTLNAAKAKQQHCERKRWRFMLAGKTITLKDEAEKVTRWLDRFKAVGDIAVNAAPIYAGLPWAGIRLLLEVSIVNMPSRL